MDETRPYSNALKRLRAAQLRPTRQRLALARLLFENGDRHVTAERVHEEARSDDIRVSLATVYNTLNQFTKNGMLREVVVESGRSYFDTNTSEHHHFFDPKAGMLADIPGDKMVLNAVPEAPGGMEVERIDVIVRVRKSQ